MKLGKLKKPDAKKFDIMGLEEAKQDSSESGEMDPLGSELSDEASSDEKPASPELEAISDEDLLAELRRRGLSDNAEKASEKASPDEDYFA